MKILIFDKIWRNKSSEIDIGVEISNSDQICDAYFYTNALV